MCVSHSTTRTLVLVAGLGVCAWALLPGCSAGREAERNTLVDLDRLDDASTEGEEVVYRSTRLEGAGLSAAEPVRRITREEATGGLDDVDVATPRETPAPTPRTSVNQSGGVRVDARPDSVVVAPLDAMVGQVSGRPIFASDFFEQMDARMTAEARLKGQREFLIDLQDQISAALRDVIRDELLLAEFEAVLTPNERQGIAAFIDRVRGDLIRQSGGSAELANELYLADEGLTLEEKVEAESRQQLVRQMVGRLLRQRSYIPWRDVRRAYLRDFEEFHPPATARLRMIWTPADEPERSALVQSELAAGTAFSEVAEQYSDYRPETGGLLEVELAEGGLAETEVFAVEELNNAVTGLSVGEVVGPIDWTSRRVWLTLESVGGESVTLYDAQDDILNLLRQERLGEVQAEFFIDLQRRGSLSDVDRMEAELFRLGAERYLISGQTDAPSQ